MSYLEIQNNEKKLTEDFFPSFENMKIIFTYIMFTFFKTRNNKKKTSGVITRKYFLWTTV